MKNTPVLLLFIISVLIACIVVLAVNNHENGEKVIEIETKTYVPKIEPKEVIQITASNNGFFMLCKNGEIWYYRWVTEKYTLIKEKD